MGWCKKMLEEAEEKNLALERKVEALEELVELIDWAYEQNPSHWHKHKDKAECLIYGWHFTKESAEKAVSEMKNEDGSAGQYWSVKDAADLATSLQIDFNQEKFNLYDFYYVLNMERSDYFEPNENPQVYINRALKFLRDKDGPEGKAKKYYLMPRP